MRDAIFLFAQTNLGPAVDALPKPSADSGRIQTAVSQILIALAVISILFVVIGGVRYAASQGNPDQITQAKNTIIYAIVGLVVAMFAYAIIQFVTGRLT